MRKQAVLVLAAFALAMMATVGPASASVAVYSNEAGFTGALQTGYYLEDFNYAPWTTIGNSPITSPQSFSGGLGWAYDISSPAGLSGQPIPPPSGLGGAVANYASGQAVTVTFTGMLPKAVGGIFFVTDIGGNLVNGATVTINLSNGGTYTYLDSSNWDAFTGFISDSPITSMTLQASNFATMDHLYVGNAVPEPATIIVWSLLGFSVMGLRVWRRRGNLVDLGGSRKPWSNENRTAILEIIGKR